MGIFYCRRDDVQRAIDSDSTARNNAQIDRQIEATSRDIEQFLHRTFYPQLGTKYFAWPNDQMGRAWRLWLDQSEIFSLTSITAGGALITDYFLEPANDGPPYDRIEINLAGGDAFRTGGTHQRDVALTGVFAGAPVVDRKIGTLSADLAADPNADATVTFTTADFGVGDVLLCGAERVVITGVSMVDSTLDIAADLAQSNAATTVTVTSGAAFAVDTVLLIGAERMLIVDIAGNTLIVKRAWDGSVLALHTTGASIYTLTGVQLDRAQLGTVLALHTTGTPIYQWQVPGPVRQLCVAEVLNTFEQERSAYARTVGSGDNVRNASGAGIGDLRARVYRSHGRKARLGAV